MDETNEDYDPSVAYCINGDGRLAVASEITELYFAPELADLVGDDGLMEKIDLICYECKEKKLVNV